MPAERALIRKVREVLRLRHAFGVSERKIAVPIGLSRSTVGEYLRRAAVSGIAGPVPEGVDDAELERRLFTLTTFDEKPTRPLPDWSHVRKELKRRAVTLLLLWRNTGPNTPTATATAGFAISTVIGAKPSRRPCGRHTAEKQFVDFAGDTVPVFDAASVAERRAHIFVAVLGASLQLPLRGGALVGRARRPDWRARQRLQHDRRRAQSGGLRQPQAGVTTICRYEAGINRTCQELAEHYDTAILHARPPAAARQGQGRSGVQIVQRFLLARPRNHRFFSLHELNAAIRGTVADLNAKICASSASAGTSCSQRSIGRRSKACPRRPIKMPSGRSAGSRRADTRRWAVTCSLSDRVVCSGDDELTWTHNPRDPACVHISLGGTALCETKPFSAGAPDRTSNVNTRRTRRAAVLVGRQHENGAFFRVACGDPGHRAQTGSGPPGAKGSLRIG